MLHFRGSGSWPWPPWLASTWNLMAVCPGDITSLQRLWLEGCCKLEDKVLANLYSQICLDEPWPLLVPGADGWDLWLLDVPQPLGTRVPRGCLEAVAHLDPHVFSFTACPFAKRGQHPLIQEAPPSPPPPPFPAVTSCASASLATHFQELPGLVPLMLHITTPTNVPVAAEIPRHRLPRLLAGISLGIPKVR